MGLKWIIRIEIKEHVILQFTGKLSPQNDFISPSLSLAVFFCSFFLFIKKKKISFFLIFTLAFSFFPLISPPFFSFHLSYISFLFSIPFPATILEILAKAAPEWWAGHLRYGSPPPSSVRQDSGLGRRQEGKRKRLELSTFSNSTRHEEHSIKAGRHPHLLGAGLGSRTSPFLGADLVLWVGRAWGRGMSSGRVLLTLLRLRWSSHPCVECTREIRVRRTLWKSSESVREADRQTNTQSLLA